MPRLHDRVAIVTGAAQGIGHAIARRLIDEGARVLLCDLDAARIAEAARGLDATGTRVRTHAGDVSRKTTALALVDTAVDAFGRLDILVNNAGITHAAEFLDLDEADFDRVLAVNLKGRCSCAARRPRADGGAEVGGGAIVNMSSVNAVLAIPNQVPYVVSKGGINQLTKVMALALAPHGIRVNGIGPGTIVTEMAKKAVLGSDEAKRKILSRTPMGRIGEPEEIARGRRVPRVRRRVVPHRPDDLSRRRAARRSTTPCRSTEIAAASGRDASAVRRRRATPGSPARRAWPAAPAIPASPDSSTRLGDHRGNALLHDVDSVPQNTLPRDGRLHLARQVRVRRTLSV